MGQSVLDLPLKGERSLALHRALDVLLSLSRGLFIVILTTTTQVGPAHAHLLTKEQRY